MSFYMQLSDYQQLYKLAKNRTHSWNDYFDFEAYQGSLLVRYLEHQGCPIADRDLLDLGCGFGGYITAFVKAGANVVGLDLTHLNLPGINFIQGDALRMPVANGSYDFVVCASLIEHVADPASLLTEIARVLKKDGILYLSYPPFYSPKGGHQFSPYHLLGKRAALYITQKRGVFQNQKWLSDLFPERPASFENAFGSWGLYPLTISKTSAILKRLPFQLIDRSTRLLPVNFAGIPLFGEFLTWHVQFLLRKK